MKFRDFFLPPDPKEGPPEFRLRDLLVFCIIFPLTVILPLILMLGAFSRWDMEAFRELFRDMGWILIIGAILLFVLTPLAYYGNLTQRRRLYQIFSTSKLQDTLHEDFVTKLVQINFKFIERYYDQTQAQAKRSFALACVVSLLSFGIIAAGVLMMFTKFGGSDPTPGYVTAGAGVLSQFISSVFFYLYNQTILKMSEYHRKLVLTQNISLALKIAAELPEPDRAKAQESLVDRLSLNFNQYVAQ